MIPKNPERIYDFAHNLTYNRNDKKILSIEDFFEDQENVLNFLLLRIKE